VGIETLIPQIVADGIQWVRSQRDLYQRDARELTAAEKIALGGFFDATTLERARIKWVHVLQNPPFYAQLQTLGFPLIPFASMSGITFDDSVLLASRGVYRDPPNPGLLFHELVHVVQYEVLGIDTFIDRYVRGYFGRGFAYKQIPLEEHAYRLQERFETPPAAGSSLFGLRWHR
jgi:hypothetical protein